MSDKATPEVTYYRDETGRLHREDGPAVINRMGKQWWFQGRPHREDGPAIEGEYGTRMYFWRGVIVASELIEERDTLTVEQALKEENSELQRIKLEIIGWDKLILHQRTKLLDEDRDSGAALYRFEIGSARSSGAEDVTLVKVIDSTPDEYGVRREYILRVPPTTRTAQEAVAWTFNVSGEDYAPVAEA